MSFLTPTSSSASVSLLTANLNLCVAAVEVWTEPEGEIIPLWECKPELLYQLVHEKTNIKPKAVATYEGGCFYIECESESQCEYLKEKMQEISEWQNQCVKVRCVHLDDETVRRYHNISLGRLNGQYFMPPAVSPEEQALDKLVKSLSMEEQSILCQKLQGTPLVAKPKPQYKDIPKSVIRTPVEIAGATAGVSESLSNKPPKFQPFSGEIPIPKGEIAYEHWRYDVVCAMETYTEGAILEGIRRSVRGRAASTARCQGTNVRVRDLIAKCDVMFGHVATGDTMLQEFYSARQGKNETVSEFAARIEDTLTRVRVTNPMSELEAQAQLRDRFFHGVRKSIRDTIRYLNESKEAKYNDLLVAARRSERENDEPKLHARVNAAQVLFAEPEDEAEEVMSEPAVDTSNLVQTLRELIEQLKENRGRPKRTWAQRQKQPFNMQNIQCYRCKQWGHMAKTCTEPQPTENSNGGQRGNAPARPT